MLLEVAPCFEEVTAYSLRWSQRLYEELDERHVSCLREEAVRDTFKDYVNEYDPELITFYDHGNETLLVGNDEKPLLDTRNVELLKGREMYTMCCLAAKKLGPAAYRMGCKAWWGYTKVFSFVTTDEEIFGKLANMGLILKRKEQLSWEECVSRVTDAYNEEIDKGGNPWTIISLINDRDALQCWTDANQPSSDCVFRRMAIRFLGTTGHKISRTCAGAIMLFLVSWGVTLHACASELYAKGGYREVLSPQGEWIGLAGIFIAFIVLSREHTKWLDK